MALLVRLMDSAVQFALDSYSGRIIMGKRRGTYPKSSRNDGNATFNFGKHSVVGFHNNCVYDLEDEDLDRAFQHDDEG